MNEIAEASERISALLAGSQEVLADGSRASTRVANVHELLHSTLKTLFGDKVGPDKPIKCVKDWDKSIPEISCYPGGLNQVWDVIINNAIQAMEGRGTLTIRTAREGDDMIRVEIGDDGPGIPEEIVDRIFTAFFTTKPFGEGDRARPGPGTPNHRRDSIRAISGSNPNRATPASSSCCR